MTCRGPRFSRHARPCQAAVAFSGSGLQLRTGRHEGVHGPVHVLGRVRGGQLDADPGLALRDRSLVTMATLVVLGRSEELKGHIGYALNIGISREEILEMIMHLAHYAGWPFGVGALRVAKEVFSATE